MKVKLAVSFKSPGDGPLGGPNGITFDGKYVWCRDKDGMRLCQVNPGDGAVISFFKCIPYHQIAGLAWDGNHIWASIVSKKKIYKYHTTTGEVLSTIDAPGSSPHGLEWVNGHLWSASLDERKIYKVKAENGEVVFSFDSPGTRPHGLAWDGSHLWSVDTNDKVIYKHNSQSGEVLDSFECPEGTEPHGLAWDGSSLWYDDQFCNMLYRIEFLD